MIIELNFVGTFLFLLIFIILGAILGILIYKIIKLIRGN